MSKNFRSNLKMWLDKVLRSLNTAKKEMIEIAKKVANLTGKEAKNEIQDIITDHLFTKVEELKSRKTPHQDAVKFVVEFLQQEGLQVSNKLQTSIAQYLEKYFTNSEENKRNYQDYVLNIWDPKLQKYDCICSQAAKDFEIPEPSEECYRCGRVCHVNCLWQKEINSEVYECPFCYLTYCLPNKKVAKVLFAGYLRQNKKDKIQYKINLPLQNITEYGLIQSRCARLSNNSRYELSWPQNSAVYLNNKKLIEHRPLPINSPLKRRTDEQIPLDRRLMTLQNNIIVIEQKHQHLQSMRPVMNENHFIIIVAVRMVAAQEMQQELLKQENRPSESKSKQCLRRYLDRGIQDCFIDKIKVKLQCQFYGSKITLPVRSKHCISHYEPFDLKGFIFANMTNKSCTQKWKCPVCKKRAYDLQIDQYLLQLINSNPSICEVFFNSHGEAQIITENQLGQQSIEKGCNIKQQFVERELNQVCEVNVKDQKLNVKQSSVQPLINRQQVEIIDADFNALNRQNMHSFDEYIELLDVIPQNQVHSQAITPAIKRNYALRKSQLNLDQEQVLDRSIKKQKKDVMVQQNNQKNPIFNLLQKNIAFSSQKIWLNDSKLQNNNPPFRNKNTAISSKKLNNEKSQVSQNNNQKIDVRINPLSSRRNQDASCQSLKLKFADNLKKQLIKSSMIQIQSEDESTEIVRLRKLKYLKQQLSKDKGILSTQKERMTSNASDKAIFNKLAQKFLKSLSYDC